MASMKLVSVRHGDEHKSIIFFTGMRPVEARLLLAATFLSPHQQQQTALALSDPVTGQLISLDEACADANALPGLLDLCLQQQQNHDSDRSSGPPAASSASFSSSSSARPILHHQQHQHRVQPYPQHARQPSLQQLQQQQLQSAAAAAGPAAPRPASPLSPSSSAAVPPFPPPFVLSLHSAADIEQALQLSDSLIILLFVHPPSSPTSPAAPPSASSSSASSALSALYHQLASSSLYPHLLFLSIDQSLFPLHAAPSLHLYYAGSSIGQVLGVNEEQMMTLVASSEELLVALQGAEGAGGSGGEDEAQTEAEAEEEKAAAAEQQAVEQVLREGGVRWEEGEEEEGVLLSSDEAMALEALVLRSHPDVRAAYAAFPSLSLVVDAFMRIARHVGRQKEERRRRQAMAGSRREAAAPSASAGLRFSVYDQLLHSTLSALLQHGLMEAAEAEAVLRLYADRDPRVLRVIVLYQQSGKEEQLMEGLIAVGQQAAQARGGAGLTGGGAEERDARRTKGRTLGREWEGRDDSEGMRARKAAATEHQTSPTRVSSGRSRWGTPARSDGSSGHHQRDEEEEDEDDDDEDDGEDEEEDEQDEEDNALQEEEEAAAEAASAQQRTRSSQSQSPSSFSPSSPLYTSAVNTLAALSSSQLISPSQLSLFVSLLTSSHPLIVAAFVSYADTQDLPDLLDTLLRIHAASTSGSSGSTASSSAAAAAQPPVSSAPEAAGGGDLTSLLSLLPAAFLSSHGRHISSLVAQRDRILLSALQIWCEQERRSGAQAGGSRGAGGSSETQQLLAIIIKRVEKEKHRQAAADSRKGGLEAASTSHSGGSLPSSSAPFLRPASPQSPQVTREQVNELRSAYHTGLQHAAAQPDAAAPSRPQYQQQQQQQQAEEKEEKQPESTADSTRQAALQRALDGLQVEGVLDAQQCGWVQSRYEQGDARVLAVLQVFASTGDDAEMADSLRRIGQQFDAAQQAASSSSSSSSTTSNAASSSTAGEAQQGEEEAVKQEQQQQQQQQEPAVTVEDVTAEDKEQGAEERNGRQEQQLSDDRKEETTQ